jgi:hypothetical protein
MSILCCLHQHPILFTWASYTVYMGILYCLHGHPMLFTSTSYTVYMGILCCLHGHPILLHGQLILQTYISCFNNIVHILYRLNTFLFIAVRTTYSTQRTLLYAISFWATELLSYIQAGAEHPHATNYYHTLRILKAFGGNMPCPRGQSVDHHKQGPGLDSRRHQIFWATVGLEQDPLSPCEDKWGATRKKSSGSGLENWD